MSLKVFKNDDAIKYYVNTVFKNSVCDDDHHCSYRTHLKTKSHKIHKIEI